MWIEQPASSLLDNGPGCGSTRERDTSTLQTLNSEEKGETRDAWSDGTKPERSPSSLGRVQRAFCYRSLGTGEGRNMGVEDTNGRQTEKKKCLVS